MKLKEQIEAAKRSLSEMPALTSNTIVADGPNTSVASDLSGTTNSALFNAHPTDALNIPDTTVVDLTKVAKVAGTKVIEINAGDTTNNKLKTDHVCSSSVNPTFEGFHFFHRKNLMDDPPVAGSRNLPIMGGDMVAEDHAEDWLFDDLDRRLKAVEIDIARNCLHIDELIKLTSGIGSSKVLPSTPKSMRRLVQRYVFWFVIGCLAIGWFALTPSGHLGLNYLLTLR